MIMNTAALPPYDDGFSRYPDEGSSQDPILGPQRSSGGLVAPQANMTGQKRKRTDDPGNIPDYAGASTGHEGTCNATLTQQQQQQQQPQPHTAPEGFLGNATSASGSSVSPAGATSHTIPLNESADSSSTGHWQQHVSPYADVASCSQQPYFYPQTHPSAYNSPWPPGDGGVFAGSPTSSAPGAGANMPYFPSAVQGQEGGEVGFAGSEQALVSGFAPDPAASPAPFVYASGNENGVPRSDVPPEASAFLYEDAGMHLKLQSLPILEHLATQLIHTITKASFPQIQEIMQGNDDEDSQAYTALKNLFDTTRKVYSGETPFIDAIAIQMFQPAQQEIIRKANIATFVTNILGAHDVSFFDLNAFFMETFVPLGHRLLKWQGAIYLELKTQTYISALINSEGPPEAMLDELFPSDLDAQILTRHPDAPSLSPSEQDFIDRSRQRRTYLLAENIETAINDLPKKYAWADFVREFASNISKNIDSIMNTTNRPVAALNVADRRVGAAMTALDTPSARDGSKPNTTSTPSSESKRNISHAGSQTQRQPWTKAEEDALLAGLESVNGPHWSQILALYGRGGSRSEVLKDRNQVQLKDKARNLKLQYLKMGQEVPEALRRVTGELKKRGGQRIRAALFAEEDGGIIAGAGGTPEEEQGGVGRGGRGAGAKKRGGRK